MLRSLLLCLWMLLQNMGLGVLGVGHADCKRFIYKIFLHPPLLPQLLPVPLFSCTQYPQGILEK